MAIALGRLSLGGFSLPGLPFKGRRRAQGRHILASLLIRFWALLLIGLGGLALALQILHWITPPASPVPEGKTPASMAPAGAPATRTMRIAPPISALQEPLPGHAGLFLPRIAADGRTPMQVYAGPFDRADSRPRIGILLAGMGLNGADSAAAMKMLPDGVTLAFSPYAQRTAPLLEAARRRGQEILVSLPLEPAGAPLHDAGDRALLVSAGAEQNLRRLEWSLAQLGGYVGATGALGALHGERFAGASQPMRDMLQSLAGRGLLYVDPRPGASLPPTVVGRVVDLVIDARQERAEIERMLRQLEQTARASGSALGLAGAPVPVTVGTIANWAAELGQRGFVLAPISALMPERAH